MLETSGRLLKLLSLLQARRDWPGATLAERLGVTARTVRRDVDRLRELGYPVRSTRGPDGGYRLDAGAELPPLLLDDEQAVAIAVALGATPVRGLEDAAGRALATIRQVMPARLRGRVDAVQVTRVPRQGDDAGPPVDADVLLAIGTAVRAREVLRFDYAGRGDGTPGAGEGVTAPPRRVEPHHLVTWGGRWYLVAWDLGRGDWRTFRVDRISPRHPTGPRFVPRDLPVPDVATYVAQRFSTPGWSVRGTAVLAASAGDVARWAGDAVVEPLGDDRCRLAAGSWSWAGLALWFAAFDVPFEVEEPEELRTAARALVERFSRATPSVADGAVRAGRGTS